MKSLLPLLRAVSAVALFAMMVLTFAGSAMAARRGTHIAVEFLLDKLPRGARRVCRAAAAAVTTVFFGVSVPLCWQVAEAMQFQPMIALDQPLSVIYYGILFGLVLTTIRTAMQGAARWRAGEPEAPPDPSLGGAKL